MKNFKQNLHDALDKHIEEVSQVDRFDLTSPSTPEELVILSEMVAGSIYRGMKEHNSVNNMQTVLTVVNDFAEAVLMAYINHPCQCPKCVPRH